MATRIDRLKKLHTQLPKSTTDGRLEAYVTNEEPVLGFFWPAMKEPDQDMFGVTLGIRDKSDAFIRYIVQQDECGVARADLTIFTSAKYSRYRPILPAENARFIRGISL